MKKIEILNHNEATNIHRIYAFLAKHCDNVIEIDQDTYLRNTWSGAIGRVCPKSAKESKGRDIEFVHKTIVFRHFTHDSDPLAFALNVGYNNPINDLPALVEAVAALKHWIMSLSASDWHDAPQKPSEALSRTIEEVLGGKA